VVVLHVGTHKTGTTSIQKMLAGNEDHFASEGLCYPTLTRVGAGHHNLIWELLNDERFDPAAGSFADLVTELSRDQPPRVLLSAEGFEYLYERPALARSLKEGLESAGYRVEVVLALREVPSYLESLYYELTKHGLSVDLDGFVDEAVSRGSIHLRDMAFCLRYEELTDSFASVFGAGSLHVLAYGPSIVSSFFARVGALLDTTLTEIPGWDRSNVRPEGTAGNVTGVGPREATATLSGDQRERLMRALGDPIAALAERYS
jgi:hypothetical protein